ncbi:UNVERIFIED_ORG: hypothetical protein GGI63_001865 [Rhizobium esperanzae]|nr:hypothetical protein [Rhizobium phaseoli]MDK4728848.1 hypothetical protein [Rhizobium phaseoli]NKE91143.1 hypothetical protein [Rhizobium phaseoli]
MIKWVFKSGFSIYAIVDQLGVIAHELRAHWTMSGAHGKDAAWEVI